jgi:hypothetical protein
MAVLARQLTELPEWEWKRGMDLQGGSKVVDLVLGPEGRVAELLVSRLQPGESPTACEPGQARPDPDCPLVLDQLLVLAQRRHGVPLVLQPPAPGPAGRWSVRGHPGWSGRTPAEALLAALRAVPAARS